MKSILIENSLTKIKLLFPSLYDRYINYNKIQLVQKQHNKKQQQQLHICIISISS